MLSWIGYIRCDICGERLKFDDRVPYNDLNICSECKVRIDDRARPSRYIVEDEIKFKKDLPEKTKPKKKKK